MDYYKELIEQLREHSQSWAAYSDHDLSIVLQEAADAIGTLLSKREETGWVSVKDRLPEETGGYLVNIHQEDDELGECGDFVIEAWYQKNGLLFAPKEVGWILMNEWYDFTLTMRKDISHWMPFPTPPDYQQTEVI